MAKKLFIRTYGCQMNVYDSARMADVLAPHGFEPVGTPEGADMVILNTCHIREKAAEKVYSELGRLRREKDARANGGERMILAVAGCVAQAEGEEILRRAPYVDLVVGPQTFHRLPELLAKLMRASGTRVVDTEFPAEDKFDRLPEEAGPRGVTAFLAVQEGCDKFCTFCVVPYTRGVEQSRPVAAIEEEARRLVATGVRQITLLGQNVNAYRGEGPDGRRWGLGRLIRHLAAKFDGISRIRYTTSHPRDMDDDLIDAHRDVPGLMPFLHLPVQSGSDSVLAAMNRKHTADDYRRVVDRLRSARADIALSSDFIVGFPGESAEDFEGTLRIVEEVGFAQAYSFKYSRRPGTPAASAPKQVPEAEKAVRLTVLQELLRRQQTAFNEATVGEQLPVLFEQAGRHSGQLAGRTPYAQAIHAVGPARLIGRVVACTVSAAGPNSLEGRVLTGSQEPADTGERVPG